MNAVCFLWLLLVANEFTIFGRREWMDFVFGGEISNKNLRFWAFGIIQMSLLYYFFGAKAEKIKIEFANESRRDRIFRDAAVALYIISTIFLFYIVRFA